MTMFVKLLLLKKTHTFFFLRAQDFLLHSFLQTAVVVHRARTDPRGRVLLLRFLLATNSGKTASVDTY